MSKLRITYRQRTTGGVHTVARSTTEVQASAFLSIEGTLLVFRDVPRGRVLFAAPESCVDSVLLIDDGEDSE